MSDSQKLIEAFDARVERRNDRRAFFTTALGAAAVGAGAFAFASAASAQSAANIGAQQDLDILNFALNLEYLEANFYSYAVFGTPIAASMTTGTGTNGYTTSATYNAGARAVNFQDPVVAAYAKEIAQDEINHVNFLRSALTSAAVAQPTIDVGITPTGAFSTAARAAKLIPDAGTGNTQTSFFDVYASDDNFLLGAFIFEDVGVTAYKGASPLISNATYLSAAAGILAVEAYHASLVRTVLYARGTSSGGTAIPAAYGGGTYPARTPIPALITSATAISDARDSLDGSSDDDQGIASSTINGANATNIVPTDSNGLAYSRTPGSVLNIVYLSKAAITAGGFFPNGVNGNIKTSTLQS
ncbi:MULTISPECIES: ferritin-like domain-containing protein [unclassified Sphingomonas]|uniref:ferritin-like domain-containing protein n=1 Tax=unclassified Sphingomonas TaxID=196159 RepID=UPI001F58C821|nr:MULTISPECIES: ferritin-like domain-containing protein [unclassified Sphingomonas]